MKNRAASQRALPTPTRNGSPRGKATEEAFLQRTSLKGKGAFAFKSLLTIRESSTTSRAWIPNFEQCLRDVTDRI
jgi:hypothetical protein